MGHIEQTCYLDVILIFLFTAKTEEEKLERKNEVGTKLIR